MAKAPVPGRAKTRLCPPCTPAQAALLAEAALVDTLATVATSAAPRRVLVLDGAPGPWLLAGFTVVAQRAGDLAQRLAAAMEDVAATAGEGPVLVIGMDTPQVTAAHLDRACHRLQMPGGDAVLGLADDGGWWALGLPAVDGRVFDDVPMSTPLTGARQGARLAHLGYRVTSLPRLRDVDRWADACAVARLVPQSRFGRLVGELAA